MANKIVSAKCNCGAVAFELTNEAQGIFVCHCSICRRLTGSNGIAVVIIGNQGFHWTSGEDSITTWRKPGHDWISCFCSVCGSTLPVANDKSSMAVPAGLLSGGLESLSVLHHIWVDSKASWDVIGDSGQQHLQAMKI